MARIPPTPFGARVCVRGMRWGRDPIRLPKTPLEKNGYALGMRQPHSSLVIWIRPGSRKIPLGARVCVTGMRWGQDPIGLPKPSLEKKWICAGYAPATFLARHLDPVGTRGGSCSNQSGARVCVRGMRLSSHALSLAKVPLDKKQICAGYALATLLARHLDPRRAPPR